jgi:hypothetical protein
VRSHGTSPEPKRQLATRPTVAPDSVGREEFRSRGAAQRVPVEPDLLSGRREHLEPLLDVRDAAGKDAEQRGYGGGGREHGAIRAHEKRWPRHGRDLAGLHDPPSPLHAFGAATLGEAAELRWIMSLPQPMRFSFSTLR